MGAIPHEGEANPDGHPGQHVCMTCNRLGTAIAAFRGKTTA